MTIVTPFFGRIEKYKRLLNVFKKSTARHMPDSNIEVVDVVLPIKNYTGNKIKDHHWDTYHAFMAKISRAIEIDDNVLMSDVDIMFVDSVNSIWCENFDIAITVRDIKQRYNTGICFIKPTKQGKEFLKLWKQKTKEIAKEFDLNKINRWWGIDQASLHYTIEEFKNIKLIELPCKIWNAEQSCWQFLNSDTKVIHIKSGLRKVFFNEMRLQPKHAYLQPILNEMREYQYDNN